MIRSTMEKSVRKAMTFIWPSLWPKQATNRSEVTRGIHYMSLWPEWTRIYMLIEPFFFEAVPWAR